MQEHAVTPGYLPRSPWLCRIAHRYSAWRPWPNQTAREAREVRWCRRCPEAQERST